MDDTDRIFVLQLITSIAVATAVALEGVGVSREAFCAALLAQTTSDSFAKAGIEGIANGLLPGRVPHLFVVQKDLPPDG